uniref:DRIM domain-containing protein n=1 Tax=Globodera pallida TaxID=36090 RepID=A0A183BKH0_GLOPA
MGGGGPYFNFGSFRVQLLRLLGKLPSARPELRTRYLSPKLITLYRDEFMQFDEPFPTTSSKPVKGEMDSEVQQLCEENGGKERQNDFVDTDDDNLESPKKDFCPKTGKESVTVKPLRFRVGRRNAVQAIKALLAVYGRFSNPRGVFREREIHDIYYELLLVNEAEVQRAALGCLFTYKYAWLTPYKTHLEALLDPRQLRDHLVLFVVDNRRDADDLLDEHSLTDQHQTNDENDTISGLERSFSSLDSKMDIVRSVSLNKLKSSLGSLSDVFHFLGPFLSDAQLALLFASIILIARILLQHSSQRYRQKEANNQMDGDGTTSMERFLKSLRKVLFLTLIKSRPNLPTSAFHSLFQQFLGPLISDHNEGRVFTSKCLSLPVSAIRLFCTWGQINRYFPLLNVPLSIDFADSDSICHSIVTTPMALLCDQLFLLRSSATKSTIQMDILRVVCSMLDSNDENTLESAKIAESFAADLITALPQVPLEMPEMNAIPPAFGVSLVLSNGQLDKILAYMSHFVNTAGEQLGSKVADQMGRIPTIYFDLLSRLSSHIQRPELASMFAHTLLRFVTSKNGLMLKRRPDRAVVVLATLARLAPHLEDPLDAVARLSSLFSHLEGRQLRWALTQMAFSIRENPCLPSGAKNLIDLLEALESWDLRRIEDPDADRRCEALLRLHDWYEQRNRHVLLEDGAAHILPLMAHSHVYSMLQNSDISLRGTAANTFRQLIQFVADPPTAAKGNFDVVRMLRSHFIPLILRGLRASVEDESARHEFIQCLASLARCFPNEPQLASFRLIIGSMAPASAEFVVDPDIDFFECAMHIQLHRRQRAFHRLAERLNSGELSVGHSPLLRFIVPIVQPYLMDTAPNRSALSDQALHLFSSILRRTPWPKYCQMLYHFLRQLDTVEEERTKGAIRVVSAVLNAFHFDLRHLQISDQKKRGEYNGGREVGNAEGNVERMEEDDEEEAERDEQQKESGQRESDGRGKSEDKEKRRIFVVVKGRLLPRLRECLHNWSGANKPGSNWDLEEQKLLRAPLTLAVVKLLEWLPPHVAEQHLHGLVLFLKHLLMSRSASTRQNARKLLEQMVCLLGPAKLPFVLREVKQALNKGYQMHVMVVTVHALIGALEGHLANGDMEPVLREVVDVCRWETFGSNNDKYGTAGGDVDRRSDSHGVPEARASGKRTGHTLTIVGRFVAKLDLLEQYVFAVMRDIANANSRSETVRKLADWLRALNVGLRINAAIGSREQLRWALRLFDENLRLMSADERRLSQMNGESSTAVGRRPVNCLLLPPEPKRLGVIQRVAVKSKVHIFVEFALQILVDQLAKLRHLLPSSGEVEGNSDEKEEHDNRDKFEEENIKNDKIFEDKSEASDLQQIVPLLEQFVPLLIEALKQKYDKIIALSLRALLHLFKSSPFSLPQEANARYALLVHLKLCVRLLNDDSVRCRQFVALALRRLLCSVTPSAFSDCLAATNDWLAAKKPPIRLLAWRAFSQFIASECQHFGPTHLRQIVQRACHSFSISTKLFADQSDTTNAEDPSLDYSPLCSLCLNLITQIDPKPPGKIVRKKLNAGEAVVEETEEDGENVRQNGGGRWDNELAEQAVRSLAHLMPSLSGAHFELTCKKLSKLCWAEAVKESDSARKRLTIFKLIGALVVNIPSVISEQFSHLCSYFISIIYREMSKKSSKYTEELHSLAVEVGGELRRRIGDREFTSRLAKCQRERTERVQCRKSDAKVDIAKAVRSLAHLMPSLSGAHFELTCKKLSKLCWAEAVKESDSARKRLTIFKLIGALAVNIPSVISEQFSHLCSYFISIIYREMSKKSSKYTEELHSLAVEVGGELRRRIGDREFTSRLAKCQRERTERVQCRKSDAKTLFVTDPVAALVDKQRRHERKKEARRRRLDIRKPYRALKRRRRTANGNTNESDEL